MIHEETFAPLASTIEKFRRLRLAAPAVVTLLALICIAVIRQLTAERKLLLFDLGIGLILATALFVAARRAIAGEAGHRRRASAAVLIGVTAACGALGVLAISLAGKPLGLDHLAQLVVIQMLGAVLGAAAGFFLGFFAMGIVKAGRRFATMPAPAVDGAWIGGLTGLAGGAATSGLPHLGVWFAAIATGFVAVCGHYAARLHERLRH